MPTVGDSIDRIKSDLTLNGSDYDAQLLSAHHSALRQLRGEQYWFLKAYGTITSTASSESITITTELPDYSSVKSADILANGIRYSDKKGFNKVTFDYLRYNYWNTDPINSGRPTAWAIDNNTMYLSHLADATYSIPVSYYKQDATLPGVNDMSVWSDDGFDLLRTMAQFIFKCDSQGLDAEKQDITQDPMVKLAASSLNRTHEFNMTGSGW